MLDLDSARASSGDCRRRPSLGIVTGPLQGYAILAVGAAVADGSSPKPRRRSPTDGTGSARVGRRASTPTKLRLASEGQTTAGALSRDLVRLARPTAGPARQCRWPSDDGLRSGRQWASFTPRGGELVLGSFRWNDSSSFQVDSVLGVGSIELKRDHVLNFRLLAEKCVIRAM